MCEEASFGGAIILMAGGCQLQQKVKKSFSQILVPLRGTASRLQNVLWDGFLTPEGSEGVPNDLRILHDMIALLQENKIRKREVSISTYTC